jgi:hypothetical protein
MDSWVLLALFRHDPNPSSKSDQNRIVESKRINGVLTVAVLLGGGCCSASI